MTAEERRVVEALQAHTGGLTVTEQDIHQAQRELQETLETTSPRAPKGTFLMAAAAVMVLIAGVVGFTALRGDDGRSSTGPSGSPDPYADFLNGSDPTAERLQGVWRLDNASLLIQFSAPNKVAFDSGGKLFGNPSSRGTYEIDGDVITVSIQGGTSGCAGSTYSMRASMTGVGLAHVVNTGPGVSTDCAPARDTEWILEQLLPTNAGSPDVQGIPRRGDGIFPAEGWQPPHQDAALYGEWVAVGADYLLELVEDGTYVVAGESGEPVDQGHWNLREDQLTMTSGGGTQCTAGSSLVLGNVEQLVVPRTSSILDDTVYTRSSVKRDPCSAPWAGAAWLLYSDRVG